MSFLWSHLPKLKKLEIIEENFHNNNSYSLLNQQLIIFSNLEQLKFTWSYYTIKSNCFQYLYTIIPNLKQLYLTMYYYRLD